MCYHAGTAQTLPDIFFTKQIASDKEFDGTVGDLTVAHGTIMLSNQSVSYVEFFTKFVNSVGLKTLPRKLFIVRCCFPGAEQCKCTPSSKRRLDVRQKR